MGIIEEIGDEVDNTLLQKRVIVYPVISNNVLKCDIDEITRCKYLGSEVNGGYSTYTFVIIWFIVTFPFTRPGLYFIVYNISINFSSIFYIFGNTIIMLNWVQKNMIY